MPRLTSFVCVVFIASLLSTVQSFAASDDIKPVVVQHSASIERVVDLKPSTEIVGEKVMAEILAGSLEFIVDAKATDIRIDAEFTVDGTDEKDIERRAKVVKLFAQRVSDGTIVVNSMFPGKAMERDSVKVSIRVPASGDCAFKSASGAIVIRGTKGALRATTKTGSIKVLDHTGGIEAVATAGTITIERATDGVRATSTSGAITVSLASNNDHPFDLESKSGAITVQVPHNYDGSVRMISVDGAVALIDPSKRVRTPDIADHSMTAEIGAAATHSLIESSSGAITLTIDVETPVK